MVDVFKNRKVLVCAGTGGVGKTTISASLGLLAASEGLKVLVLTIDPARRLATALGIDQADDLVRVPWKGRGELWASMIHPEKIFEDFVRATAPNEAAAARLLKNRLYQQMATTLSGSQEFTALEKVLSALESGRFDLIVLDTPPSQHAVDFLRAPQRIFNLFQESVTKWFITKTESPALLGKLFSRGTRTALFALQKVTGAKFIGELSDFFESISALQEKVQERSIRLHRMLLSEDTGFLLITGSDAVKLREAQEFHQDLVREGHHFLGVIVNRSFPHWQLNSSHKANFSVDVWKEIEALYEKIKAFHSSRERSYDDLKLSLGEGSMLLRVPELRGQLSGLEALERVSLKLKSELERESSSCRPS